MIIMVSAIIIIMLVALVVFGFLKMANQMNQSNLMMQQINERLKEGSQALERTHEIVGQRLDSTTGLIGLVQKSLGKLEQTNREILQKSKDISDLQDLLRAPKFRGQVGETLLSKILAEVLPRQYFQTPYQFKTGDTVDAIIRLGPNLVPVDAKFPLENFQRMLNCNQEQEEQTYRRKFIYDVKARVEEIASKYILPDEGTYDFALMYIPAENVYYEIIVKQDFLPFSISKKVIPVSPNTFYAYLQIICLGLRGLNIEHNAQRILAKLGGLREDLSKFERDFRVVGEHISNARNKYLEAASKLGRFSDKLLTTTEVKEIEEGK